VGLGLDVSGAATANEYQLSFVVPIGWLFVVRARSVLYVALHGAGTAIGGKRRRGLSLQASLELRARLRWRRALGPLRTNRAER